MMKSTWSDIEKCLGQDTLEDQSLETLESFSRVDLPPSENPAFHKRFENAQERIRKRINEIQTEQRSNMPSRKMWHEKSVGQIVLGVIIGILICLITSWLHHMFPFIN